MSGSERLRSVVRRAVPLAVRKQLAIGLHRLPLGSRRYWWTMELLRDYAANDPNGFHRFLWRNHLAYAESYRVDQRFGDGRIHRSRLILFEELERFLREQRLAPETDIHSVLEVGASLGYLLRYLETGLFRGASRLLGVDIDQDAVAAGSAHLRAAGSRVELRVADMAALDQMVGGERFDLVLCAGVLMYLEADEAASVVAKMLTRTGRWLVLAGLAEPSRDNRELTESARRGRDGTFIHNLDRMVEEAGGRVEWRRWDGPREVDGNTIYFLVASPAGAR